MPVSHLYDTLFIFIFRNSQEISFEYHFWYLAIYFPLIELFNSHFLKKWFMNIFMRIHCLPTQSYFICYRYKLMEVLQVHSSMNLVTSQHSNKKGGKVLSENQIIQELKFNQFSLSTIVTNWNWDCFFTLLLYR